MTKKKYVCQNCGKEYTHFAPAMKKDRVSGKTYIKCPKDGGSAYEKVVEQPKPKKAPVRKKAPAKKAAPVKKAAPKVEEDKTV